MSELEVKSDSKKKKTLRCDHSDCRVKLGLLGFECRCGRQFCGQHRIAEIHSCSYDYKLEARKELLKYMSSPVVGAKIAII